MSGLNVGDIFAVLKLDDAQFKTALDEVAKKTKSTGSEAEEALKKAEQATQRVSQQMQGLAGTLDKTTGAVTQQTRAWIANTIGADKLKELEKLGINTRQYIDAAAGVPGASTKMKAALAGNDAAMRDLTAATALTAKAQDDFAVRSRAAGAAVEDVGKKSSGAGKIIASLGGLFTASKVFEYVSQSVQAGSDLNETMSASATIFGNANAKIVEFAGNAARAVGLSKNEALAATAQFGYMYKQLGYTSDASADLSIKTVKLAADYGSFRNLPTQEVLDGIAGAMRGEYDSIQKLDPLLSDAAVKQEALAETGKKNADQLTAQEKATATLNLLYRDAGPAIGDFAKTADGLANSLKTSSSATKNQQAALGEQLLPVVKTFNGILQSVGIPLLGSFGNALAAVADFAEPLVKLLGQALTAFGNLPAPVSATLIALTAVTLLRGKFDGLWKGISEGTDAARTAFAQARDGSTTMGAAMTGAAAGTEKLKTGLKGLFLSNPIGLALTAITLAVSLFASSEDDAKAAGEAWKSKMDELVGTLDQVTGAATEATRVKVTDQVGSEMLAHWKELGVDITLATDAMVNLPGAVDKNSASILALTARAIAADSAFGEFAGGLSKAGVSAQDLANAFLNNNFDDVNRKLAAVGQQVEVNAAGFLELKDSSGASLGVLADTAGVAGDLASAYHTTNGETGLLTAAQAALATKNEAVKGSADGAAAATTGQGSAAAAAKGEVLELSKAVKAQDDAQRDLESSVRNTMAALDEMQHRNDPKSQMDAATRTREAAAAFRDQAAAQRGIGAAQDEERSATLALNDAKDKALSKDYNAEQKALDVAAAERHLADAHAGVQDALDHLSQANDKVYTSGEDVRKSFIEQAQEAYNAAVQAGNTAGAYDAAKAKTDELTAALHAQLVQSGLTDTQADAYIKTLGLIPDEVATAISQPGMDKAIADLEALRLKLTGIPAERHIRIMATYTGPASLAGKFADAIVPAAEAGGPLRVPGAPKGRDAAVFVGADNEHVVTSPEVDAVGGHGAMYAIRRAMLAGTLSGYAGGGQLRSASGLLSSGPSQMLVAQAVTGGGSDAAALLRALGSQEGSRTVQVAEHITIQGAVDPYALKRGMDAVLFDLRTVVGAL